MSKVTELTNEHIAFLKNIVKYGGMCSKDFCRECTPLCPIFDCGCTRSSAFHRATYMLKKHDEYIDSLLLENND